MSTEREKLLMAYLDGQMTATEASAFDETLTEEERELVAAELRLEAGIAERMREGAACPEAVWKRTELLLRNQATAVPRRRKRARPWMAAAAAAAVLMVAAAGFYLMQPGIEPMLWGPTGELEEFAATSEVAADPAAVHAFLAAHGIEASFFENYKAAGHETYHYSKLLGARENEYAGEIVVEVLYNCCGFPAKVVVARPESAAGRELLATGYKAMTVRAMKETPEFVASVVSGHDASELIALVRAETG